MSDIEQAREIITNPTIASLVAFIIFITGLIFYRLINSNSKYADALIKSAGDESEAVKSRDKQVDRLINTLIEGQTELINHIKANTEATERFYKTLADNRLQIDAHDTASIGRNNELKAAVNTIGVNVADASKQTRRSADEIIANLKQNVDSNTAKIELLLKRMSTNIEALSTSEQVSEIKDQIAEIQNTLTSFKSDIARVEALVKPKVAPLIDTVEAPKLPVEAKPE